MELLSEMRIWLYIKYLWLGQKLKLRRGRFVRVPFLVLSILNHRKELWHNQRQELRTSEIC